MTSSTAWARPSSIPSRRGPAANSVAIARAFLIAREVFDLPAVWREIDALDNRVPAATQTRLLLAMRLIVGSSGALVPAVGPAARHRRADGRVPAGRPRLDGHVAELLPQAERELIESGATPM